MKQPVCDLCGSTDFTKAEGVFVCQSCGAKYSIEEARNLIKEVPESPFAHVSNALKDTSESPLAQMGGALKDASASPFDTLKDAANPIEALKGDGSNPFDAIKDEPASLFGSNKGNAANPFEALTGGAKEENGVAFEALSGLGSMMSGSIKDDKFDPIALTTKTNDPKLINDYVCRGWCEALDEYKKIEHPDQEEQQKLVAVSKECLEALNMATTLDIGNIVQTAVIYDNCRQIVKSVKNTNFYTQNDDGSWRRNSLPLSTDFKVAGQSDAWDKVYEKIESMIEQEYYQVNPEELNARSQLATQEAQLQQELDELKSEKKSHGFFDFAGKREVKDRMAPVKDQLGEVRSQLNTISRRAQDYAELKINEYAQAQLFEHLSL